MDRKPRGLGDRRCVAAPTFTGICGSGTAGPCVGRGGKRRTKREYYEASDKQRGGEVAGATSKGGSHKRNFRTMASYVKERLPLLQGRDHSMVDFADIYAASMTFSQV
jgi:hypothetical protein